MSKYNKGIYLPEVSDVSTPPSGMANIYFDTDTTKQPSNQELMLKTDLGTNVNPNTNRSIQLPSSQMYLFDDLMGTLSSSAYLGLVRLITTGVKGTSTGDHMGIYILRATASITSTKGMYTDTTITLVGNEVFETCIYLYPSQTSMFFKFGRTDAGLDTTTTEMSFIIDQGYVQGVSQNGAANDIRTTEPYQLPTEEWVTLTMMVNADATAVTFRVRDQANNIIYNQTLSPPEGIYKPARQLSMVSSCTDVSITADAYAIDTFGFGFKTGYFNLFGRMP